MSDSYPNYYAFDSKISSGFCLFCYDVFPHGNLLVVRCWDASHPSCPMPDTP